MCGKTCAGGYILTLFHYGNQADTDNGVIRRFDVHAGVVTTFAGTVALQDYADGLGTAAAFNLPKGVSIDSTDSFCLVVRVACASQ